MKTGRTVRITVCAIAALAGLVVAAGAGVRAHAELVRKPTQAELSAAAAAGVAQRWQRVPAGQIFPASIGYTTDLQSKETASRVGIAPHDACAAAVDATLASQASRAGCVAALRADYTDQLRGTVYTLGVLAFATAAKASDFYARIPPASYPATGLRALAVPGTAAALFADAARQTTTAQLAGPYVVLAVAGYADGRRATTTSERRDSVFDPAAQLVSRVAAPLAKPVAVRCGTAQWACSELAPAIAPPPSDPAQIRPAEMATLDQINVQQAWQLSKGAGVTVAVLDTGADANAPDLAGDVTSGPDYTTGADPPGFQPPHEHGTYIASLIAGHGSGPGNALGVVGVAPEAKILSVRVILDDDEPGLLAYNQEQRFANAISKGIYYAVQHGAKVINMSLGSEQTSRSMRAAVAYALTRGVVVVASAGNGGTSSGVAPYVYPASFTGVIAVAAVTGGGTRAFFSEQNASVVLSAPGVVIGAWRDGQYVNAEGTSPAAALVSGVAALIKSRYPRLSPALVEQAMITSAGHRPSGGYGVGTGFGVVDAAAALRAAARLAAARPATGLAASAFFGPPGTAPQPGQASSAPGPIPVLHRDTALIAGYLAASGGGALCAIVTLVMLTGLVRGSRRDRRAQRARRAWQQPAQASQRPAAGYPRSPASYPDPAAGYPPQQRSYPQPPANHDDYRNDWFDPR